MNIKKAIFITSAANYSQCPPDNLPEYAFIGRSNAGKSSLINMIAGSKKLAKISSTPGKTRLINHFLINDEWYMVDLPGYGWARISKKEKEGWEKMVKEYMSRRKSLQCVFVLVDSRIPPQTPDLEFMKWLGISGIPFVIVFTKADKQSVNKTQAAVAAYKKEMQKTWEFFPSYFVTSSVTREGKEEVLKFIHEVNQQLTREK